MRAKNRRPPYPPRVAIPSLDSGVDLAHFALSALPIAVAVIVEPRHTLAHANPQFHRVFGLPTNPAGRRLDELWPEAAERLAALVDRVLRHDETLLNQAIDLPVQSQGRGRSRRFTLSLSPLAGGDDAPSGVVIHFADSTPTVASPEPGATDGTGRPAHVEQLKPLLDEMGVGLALFDRQGRIVTRNAFAEALCGPEQTAVDLNDDDLAYRPTESDGTPIRNEATSVARALRGETVAGHEVVIRYPEDRVRHLLVHAAPIRDSGGEVTGAITVFLDTTARMGLAASLDERTDELISILEATDYGIVFVDTDGRVRFSNRRLKHMFSVPDNLLSRGVPHAYFFQHLRSLVSGAEAFQAPPSSFAQGAERPVSDELVLPGHPPRYFVCTRQAVHSSHGTRLGWLETYREVTERKKTEHRQDELLTRLEQDRRRLQTLELITRIGLSTFNVQEISDVLLHRVLRAGHAQAGELLLLDADGERLVTAATSGYERRSRTGEVVRLGEGFAGRLAKSGRPVVLSGESIEREAPHFVPVGFSGGLLLGLPLMANGRLVGVMVLGYHRTVPFSDSDLSVLQILADRVALVVENARLVEHTARQAHELNALLDNLTEAIVVAEPSGKVVRVNQTALKILGWPDAGNRQVNPNDRYRLVINDTQGRPIPEHETPLARAARGEMFSEEDLWVTGLDGVRRRVAVSGGPVRDESGQILFGFNVFRDITDLRELELMERQLAEETRAQREFLEGIFQAAPIGITVISEPEHIIEMANPIARKWAGMEDPVGLTYARVYPDPAGVQALERAVHTGETQNIRDREIRAPGQDSRHFSTTFLPLSENGQSVDRVLIVSWETTDTIRSRQRAEELANLAQQHSNELEAVIAQLPEGVVIADAPNGQIRLLNPAALSMAAWLRVGTQSGSSVSMPVFEMLRPNGEPLGDDNPLNVAINQGRTVAGMEALLRQPEGRTLPVLVSAAPLRSPTRKISGAVMTLRDITALKEIDRLKDEFLSMASHELKTPLTAVKGFSQLLLRRARKSPDADERTQRALETIDEKVNYMSRLIEDLLDLSRVETDRLELRPTRTDLVALSRSTVSELQMVTEMHELALETDLDSLVGYWDEGRLEQVLINLVDNAIKYSPKGGPVVVRVERVDGMAHLSVTDRGIGISPESQRRLFERFYRAHEDRMAIGGLGLGLYLSSEIIRRHGGQIGVNSDVGKGSTFWFRLPITPLPKK